LNSLGSSYCHAPCSSEGAGVAVVSPGVALRLQKSENEASNFKHTHETVKSLTYAIRLSYSLSHVLEPMKRCEFSRHVVNYSSKRGDTCSRKESLTISTRNAPESSSRTANRPSFSCVVVCLGHRGRAGEDFKFVESQKRYSTVPNTLLLARYTMQNSLCYFAQTVKKGPCERVTVGQDGKPVPRE
jgi:hypothetical protein